MKITVDKWYSTVEVTVESKETIIREDISNLSGVCVGDEQEQFINAALEISRCNGESDVEFVEKVASMLLHSHEVEELVENLTKQS